MTMSRLVDDSQWRKILFPRKVKPHPYGAVWPPCMVLPHGMRSNIFRWFLEKPPADASVGLCRETKRFWRGLGLAPVNPKCNGAL